MNIKFASDAHKSFYEDMLSRCRKQDSYHRALFYLLGLTDDTRRHYHDLFCLDKDMIIPEGLCAGWQTGGSIRICRLALNLWNGYIEESECGFTPDDLFCCEFAEYFVEGLKLRYPEFFTPSPLS